MARPMTEETLRKKTMQSLENSLNDKGLIEKFYQDKVDEYMSFYDDLALLNQALMKEKADNTLTVNKLTVITAEKRRLSSEMRNILGFLGLKPPDENKGGVGYEL